MLMFRGKLWGQVVYDIGANIGLTTLFFSREVGEQGMVVAFEPVPANLKRLKDNLRVNHTTNVRVYDSALGEKEQTAEIAFTPEATGIATIRTDIMKRYHQKYRIEMIPIKVVPLDRLLEREEIPPPHFIKIDVEGFEYAVLRGAEKTITQYKPRIFVEIHGANPEDAKRNAIELYNLLSSWGYTVRSVLSDNALVTTENVSTLLGNLWDCVPE